MTFFDNKQPQDDKPQEPPKIKIGEEEYTQEELQQLVELGKIGRTAEGEYKTDLRKVWPEYTKSTQENKTLKEQVMGLQAQIEAQAVKLPREDEDLSDEQKVAALKQADKLGLLSKDNFQKIMDKYVQEKVANILAGRDMLDQAKKAIAEAEQTWGIKTTIEEVLNHMQEVGFKDPYKAIKDKYEPQIEKVKSEKLQAATRGNLTSDFTRGATSKEPPKVNINNDNFGSLVEEALREG